MEDDAADEVGLRLNGARVEDEEDGEKEVLMVGRDMPSSQEKRGGERLEVAGEVGGERRGREGRSS